MTDAYDPKSGDEPRTPEEKAARIALIVHDAEKAYDQMYEAHGFREAKWQYELAYDWLHEAAKLCRELGNEKGAEAHEARAEHIKTVYRHQFMDPPDLNY